MHSEDQRNLRYTIKNIKKNNKIGILYKYIYIYIYIHICIHICKLQSNWCSMFGNFGLHDLVVVVRFTCMSISDNLYRPFSL